MFADNGILLAYAIYADNILKCGAPEVLGILGQHLPKLQCKCFFPSNYSDHRLFIWMLLQLPGHKTLK